MELVTFLAADYANIAQGGKLNVMGIFRNIYAPVFPAMHPTMFLVIILGAELGEFGEDRTMTIKLMDADGKEMLKLTNPLKVPNMKGGLRPEINAILALNGIVFPSPGRYQFSLQVDKDVKGSLSLDVILSENKPALSAPTP